MTILLDTTLDVWRGNFGDPDPVGWVTTVAYLVAAALSAHCAFTSHQYRAKDPSSEHPRPWWILAVGLLCLGLNKQLDLQILVREAGIALIAFLGLGRHRRWVGRLFVFVLAILLLRVMAAAVRRARRSTHGHRLLLAGLALLATFAVVRAGTYVPGLKQLNIRHTDALHLVFELGGVVLVAVSAWRTRRRLAARRGE